MIKARIFQGIEFVVIANFLVSVMLLIVGSFLSFSDQYSLFEFNQDLYGELVNHLRMTMVYVAITEMIICAYCAVTRNIQGIALAGFFMILMVGSMSFYGKINDVVLDDNLFLFFLYIGISHILFCVFSDLKKTVYP